MNLRFEKNCTSEDEKLLMDLMKNQILKYEDQTVVPFHKAIEWKQIDIHANLSSFYKVYDDQRHIGYFDLYQTDTFIYVVSDFVLLKEFHQCGYEAAILQKIVQEADDCVEVNLYQKDDVLYDALEENGFYLTRLISKTKCIMKHRYTR